MNNNTLQEKFRACKNLLKDTYNIIADRGGTLPVEQDMAHLPSAVESIPDKGLFYNLTQYGVPEDMINTMNLSMYERDLAESLPMGTKKNVPFVLCANPGGARTFDGYRKMKYVFITEGTINLYLTFFNCTSLQYVLFGDAVQLTSNVGWSDYYLFGNCAQLKGVLGKVIEFANVGSAFNGATNIEEIYVKYTGNASATWMRPLTKLLYQCVLFTVQNLSSTPDEGATFAIGQDNLDKLNATQEGQDAIANAQANGWGIIA